MKYAAENLDKILKDRIGTAGLGQNYVDWYEKKYGTNFNRTSLNEIFRGANCFDLVHWFFSSALTKGCRYGGFRFEVNHFSAIMDLVRFGNEKSIVVLRSIASDTSGYGSRSLGCLCRCLEDYCILAKVESPYKEDPVSSKSSNGKLVSIFEKNGFKRVKENIFFLGDANYLNGIEIDSVLKEV